MERHMSFGVQPFIYEASGCRLDACIPSVWTDEQVRLFLFGEYEGRESDSLTCRSKCSGRPLFKHVSLIRPKKGD